jgi:NADPH:quinone reductase-like Zn-dependent oxidoreductase
MFENNTVPHPPTAPALAAAGGTQMKAIVCTRSGPPDVLQFTQVEKPIPQDNEVLVKIHAATVTAGDVVLRKLSPWLALPLQILFGVQRKKIPGHELAGEVVATGKAVTRFQVGDQVFGTTTDLRAGSYAEYICLPQDGMLTPKPHNLSFAEAAAIPIGGMTALYFLSPGSVQPGQSVLVYGASGSVGTYAVQLAKYYGADVTAVCSQTNFDLVESLGANQLIDYTREDFTQNGQTYDLIFDAVGKRTFPHVKDSLTPNGVFRSVKSTTREKPEALLFLKERAEAGQLKPVIDRRYPLEASVEAHRYVETGRKKGNVVITIA